MALLALALPLVSGLVAGAGRGGGTAGGLARSGGIGRALGGILGGALGRSGGSRRTAINPERVSGNRFARACAQYGVDSQQCPRADLERWASLSQRKYPNAYTEVFHPLLAGARVSVSYLDSLLSTYVQHRRGATGSVPAGTGFGVPRRLRL